MVIKMTNRSTLTPPILFTYEDYLHFSDEKRYEIINGEVYMVPSPLTYHQKVLALLYMSLWDFVEEHQIGEVLLAPLDVVLSEIDVVQPDIMYISNERRRIITEKNIQGAPDLVIEILSPSTAYKDQTIKTKIYSKYGVKEMWLVDPEKKEIQLLVLNPSLLTPLKTYHVPEILKSPLVTGFTLPLDKIFKS